jgi:peptidyl-prolyl cis-trans isomerase C
MNSMMRNGNPSSPEVALQQLIALELLVQEAKEAGLTAPATEVEESYQQMAQQAGGQAALEQRITEAGLTKEEVMHQLQRELSHRNLVDQRVAALPEIPEASLEAIYEENPEAFERVKARHILVSFEQDATEAEKAEALEKMESAVERLEAGEGFAKVAEDVSDDPGSAVEGGDLGYFGRGQMVPSFEQAAFSLEPGERSDIVESQFGYHVILVEDKKKLTFEEVEEGLRDLLGERRKNSVIGEWVVELQDAAEIEIVTSALQMPSAPGMNVPQVQGMAPPPGN